ncbi:MAG: helix-hairpin-helix domain-containing protein, partial [Thermoplasmata archaeon]|nr:helix-hairpin-helix domain-containing protein [Thermoplasmata archaeon]
MVAKEKPEEKDTNPTKAPGGNCPNCGSALDASGRCPNCDPRKGPGNNPKKGNAGNPGNPAKNNPGKGNPGNPSTAKSTKAEPEKEGGVQAILKAINLSMATAQLLYDAGFKTVDDLKKASVKDLEAIEGIDGKTARTIQKNASGPGGKPKGAKKSDDALKKWLTV